MGAEPRAASHVAPPSNAKDVGDAGSIPGAGRSPGERNGNPLHDCCLENPIDRGAWRAAVLGVAKSQTQLSTDTPVHRFSSASSFTALYLIFDFIMTFGQ